MASAKNEVRKFVEDALNRFAAENGRALGRQDRVHYEYPSCIIVLQGRTNLTDPWAAYYGELGEWRIGLGRGDSRYKTLHPVIITAKPYQRQGA